MASRIKGITVEIGGDTTGLDKALKGVNNTIRSSGSGKETAYTMQSNRTLTTRNTASAGAHTHSVSGTAASNGAHTHTVSGTAASQGVDATGKNMPPYLTVYMWKRTA